MFVNKNQFLKTLILFTSILTLSLPFGLSGQIIDTMKSEYIETKEHNISYTGFIGNTLGFQVGKRKVCSYCETKHRKFFGVGLELGFDKMRQFIVGPKFSYERGTDIFGLSVSVVPFLTSFKEFGFWVRPEVVVFPTKDHSFSIGAGININNNIARKGTLYDSFGIVGLSLRHYFIK